MGRFVLALDQGTSSSRAVLFDEQGRVVASASRDFPQLFPQPGWVEHDPEQIWVSQLDSAREALAAAGVRASDLAGIGITNQRETTVVWERASGRPIANAIVWQCRRTAGMCDTLRTEGLGAEVRARTGLVIDAYFSATKLRWLLEHTPDAMRRAEAGDLAFGTIDSWLVWKLTGGRVHVTDATNASRTMLFNIHEGAWDKSLCQRFAIPALLLPRVVDSSGVVAETDPALFGAAIPIAGIAGDQQAALFGQACFSPPAAKNTYGTGCFILLHTGTQAVADAGGLLTTVASRLGGHLAYAVEGSVFIAGAAVQWLRDGLQLVRDYSEVEGLAASVPSSDGVYVVPAFVGLGAPYWDQYARGTIVGLTRGTGRGHIVRATLESLAFQTRDVIETMEGACGLQLSELRVDGGATRNDLLMQIQADVLGRPVVRSAELETTALGAAFLAGLATGVWEDLDALRRVWRPDRTFKPRLGADRREELYAGWKRAVERARDWVEH